MCALIPMTLPRGVGRASARSARCFVMKRSRSLCNVWHRTPAAAMATLEELEETARLWQLGGRAIAPLQAAQIDELRRVFGAAW